MPVNFASGASGGSCFLMRMTSLSDDFSLHSWSYSKTLTLSICKLIALKIRLFWPGDMMGIIVVIL